MKVNLKNKTGKGFVNKALHYQPKMHISLPSNVSQKKCHMEVSVTQKYSFGRPGTEVQKQRNECYTGVIFLDNV